MQIEFFKHLFEYCEGKIEIRLLPSGRQAYFALDESDALVRFVKRNLKQNIYFGVATRDGKDGTKDNIIHIPALFVDCDYKNIDSKALWKKIKSFPFYPSLIVKSGGGVHLYWQLDEPVGKDDIPTIEDCNRRIAKRLCGDFGSVDAAHILCVPNTKNRKPEYDPPRDVECTQINSFYYKTDDFLEILPEVKSNQSLSKKSNGNPQGWLLAALQGVAEHNPGRDKTGAKIAGYFVDKLS